MYVIRFTVRKSSPQRDKAKHTYLSLRNHKYIVGDYASGGSNPVPLEHASRYATMADATLALIGYLRQIETWGPKMWVKNPVIIEVQD